MTKKQKIVDCIDPKIKFSFDESASEVDGQHVLGKVKGVFFCPDGISRNKRYYSKELWERTLSDENVKERFANRNMFGTIGHNTEINDEALQQGLISHIVTNAYIDEDGQGIGEALILNTKSGRILNTVMRAGTGVYVSSRAEGAYRGQVKGVPAVDEDTFNLMGWDFVLNPGFLKANPQIVEALEELNIEGDTAMEKVIERLNNEIVELKTKLGESLKENKSLTESVNALSEENNHVKQELATAMTENTDLKGKVDAARTEIAKFETLGDSFEEIKEAMEKQNAYVESLHNEIGTKHEIKVALKQALTFKEAVDEIGSLSDIKASLKVAENLLADEEQEEVISRASKLAKELDVPEEAITKFITKSMTDEEIRDAVKNVTEAIKAKLPATKKTESKEKEKFQKKTEAKVIDENAEIKDNKKTDEDFTPAYKKGNSLSRLMDSLTR